MRARPNPLAWLALALFAAAGCTQPAADSDADITALLPAVGEGGARSIKESSPWSRATEPRTFEFPRDHGPHEDFQIEWWYYTGNLSTSAGEPFGYQLTFFRTGINQKPRNPSRWAVRDLYTAHFALSDIGRQEHYGFQRNRRAGVGLAGAARDKYHVFNGDWSVKLQGDVHHLQAVDGEYALDLRLRPTKPVVLQGEQGLSRKGALPGNASYYYSHVRMASEGTLTVDGTTHQVSGESWMDHEFSTSFLEPGQVGWDWFSIQLDNGHELMLFQMRRSDGPSRYRSGTLVDADGRSESLKTADIQLRPRALWKSPESGGNYPVAWDVELPRHSYRLEVVAAFDDQEMITAASTGIVYWEGSVVVRGQSDEGPVGGRGYLEMTGYAGPSFGPLLTGTANEAPTRAAGNAGG
ncbi:MAG: carotenoid 1,2-hydratase [Planctomycetota bacterium]|nr:MAG: carotenoid 1,2-hydratase [Planctomycetota bacterium]